MSILFKLPTEILFLVCEKLSIDDYKRLTSTCKPLRSAIYDELSVRRHICISIILTAPHHKHDIEICHIEDIQSSQNATNPVLYDEAANALTCGGFRASVHENPGIQKLDEDGSMVMRIWNRWHQMKELYKLYLDPEISKNYRDFPAILIFRPDHFRRDDIRELASNLDGREKPSQTPDTGDWKKDHERYYQRFYLALTALWRGLALGVAESAYRLRPRKTPGNRPAPSAYWSPCDDPVKAISGQKINRTLDDLVDIVEVMEFVWGFLGYIILWRLKDEVPTPRYPYPTMRYFNWEADIAYLRPPDILKLFQQRREISNETKDAHMMAARQRAIPKNTIGFRYAAVVVDDVIDCLASYSTTLDKPSQSECKKTCKVKWQNFEATWKKEIRGTLLRGESSYKAKDGYDKIMGSSTGFT